MSLIARLLKDYQAEGWTVAEAGEGTYDLTRPSKTATWVSEDGEIHEVDLPGWDFRLSVSERELTNYVTSCGSSGQAVFTDVSVAEAGYRLMLVHLDEQIATHPLGTTLRFDNREIVATAAP